MTFSSVPTPVKAYPAAPKFDNVLIMPSSMHAADVQLWVSVARKSNRIADKSRELVARILTRFKNVIDGKEHRTAQEIDDWILRANAAAVEASQALFAAEKALEHISKLTNRKSDSHRKASEFFKLTRLLSRRTDQDLSRIRKKLYNKAMAASKEGIAHQLNDKLEQRKRRMKLKP